MKNMQKLTLVDDEFLRIIVVPNTGDTATLCFSGVGHSFGGIDVQSPEFYKCSDRATSIFIIDKKRSWGNKIDFNFAIDTIKPFIEGKVVNSIGNSMGGFLSILVTRFIDVSAVIAFSPQYSVCKSIIPSENRGRNTPI